MEIEPQYADGDTQVKGGGDLDDTLLDPGTYAMAVTKGIKAKVDKNGDTFLSVFFKHTADELKGHIGSSGRFYVTGTGRRQDGTTWNKGGEFARLLLALGVPEDQVKAKAITVKAFDEEVNEYGAMPAAIIRKTDGVDITQELIGKNVKAKLIQNTFNGKTDNQVAAVYKA